MQQELINSMPLATLLGVKLSKADARQVEGYLEVTEAICTLGNTLHGGAIMALADCLGAIAGFLNLPAGASGTTTIESKTNFLRPAPIGTRVTAVTTPVNVGKRLSVWTTTLRGDDGKSIAVVTQTQLVIP